jgi:hypothetical protein
MAQNIEVGAVPAAEPEAVAVPAVVVPVEAVVERERPRRNRQQAQRFGAADQLSDAERRKKARR